MTKWAMTELIAEALGLPTDHITPASEKPVIKPGQTERPWSTELDMTSLEAVGVDTREAVGFGEWWREYVKEL